MKYPDFLPILKYLIESILGNQDNSSTVFEPGAHVMTPGHQKDNF